MPAPYSYDLRKKAIEAVKRGERKIQVSRLFKISRNTLELWLKKEKETGDFQPKLPVKIGTVPKIESLAKFREFVAENSEKTQKQMAQLWGDNVTQQNISYACQKLGITRKKKLMVIKKEMKKKG
jgi:transposase